MVNFQNLLRRPKETAPLLVWIVAIALLMGVVTLACGGPAATPIPTPIGTPEAAANALESPTLQPTTVDSGQSEQTGSSEGTMNQSQKSLPENS
jgi:hypothetical protein